MGKTVSETKVRKKRFSRCRICQKFTQMTKEHVPPKSAFNDRSYLQYYVEQMKEADLLQWKAKEVNSNGIAVFSLCQPCNNKTGRAYGQAYIDFVRSFIDVAKPENADKDVEVEVKNLFPARVVKQAVSMILSTSNPDSFRRYEAVRNPSSKLASLQSLDFLGKPPDLSRLRIIYDELRTFVKKRDAKELPPSVRLYAYATVNSGSGVLTDILASASLNTRQVFWGVVIGLWPIHWLLTLEGKPDTQLLDMTEWAKEDYKTKRTLTVKMPCRWTFANYPLDFRSPEKYRRDGFVSRMEYDGYIPDVEADDEQRFSGAIAFARRRGTLTTDGIFVKQFMTGTYAEYKGTPMWFEGKRRNEVREYLRAQIALKRQKDADTIDDSLEIVP